MTKAGHFDHKMSSLWTAFKNLFARKTADTDSSKEKANGQKENHRAQRKHMYDEIDIKENDHAGSNNAIRIHPYDSIDVQEGKVTVEAGSSETGSNTDKLNYVELDFGENGTMKENNEKSDKPIQIIGAGSSVDYTEIQVQH